MTLHDIARKLFDAKRAEATSKVSDMSTLQGTVVSDSADGSVEIAFDGDCTTMDGTNVVRIGTLAALKEGDQAIVLLEGGGVKRPTAIGSAGWGDRITASIVDTQLLIADKADIDDLNAATGRIGSLEVDNLTIHDKITLAETSIGNLEADTATIKGNLSAATAKIGDLEADNATINGKLTAAEASIESLETNSLTAESAVIKNLEADTAKVHDLTAENLSAATGYIADLKSKNITTDNINAATGYIGTLTSNNIKASDIVSDHAEIGSLDSNYAHITNGVIDNATIGYADVNNLSAHYAEITNGKIDSALINTAAIVDEQVFTVTGNKATISEINADKITVRNLNAKNLTIDTADGFVTIGDKKTPTKEYIDSLKDELQDEIDGAVETWPPTAVPLLNNYPASQWADDTTRAKHVGDICYVQQQGSDYDGFCYRFSYHDGEFSWVLIKDSSVTKALKDISDLQTFESETTSWIDETEQGLTTIRQNHTALSGKVDKTVKSSVQLWYTKANTTAPGKPTSKVTSTATTGNGWRIVVPAWNASYPNYYYCWQFELADGTYAWSDVVRDIAMGESQGTSRDAQATADANIKSSVQLWFTKANSTAPAKPTAQVTTNNPATGNAWNLAVPTYSSTYPHYFFCYQQQKGDGTYQWSDVVYDKGTTEAMQKAQAALPSSTFSTFQSTTFKTLVDEVDEQSSTITSMSERVDTISTSLNLLRDSDEEALSGGEYISSANNASYITAEFFKLGSDKPQPELENGIRWTLLDGVGSKNRCRCWGGKSPLLKNGETYTLSWWMRVTSGSARPYFASYSKGEDIIETFDPISADDGWKRIVQSFVMDDDSEPSSNYDNGYFYIGVCGNGVAAVAETCGYRLVPGNSAEAVGSSVTTLTNTVNSVKQTADANTASISSLKTTVNNVGSGAVNLADMDIWEQGSTNEKVGQTYDSFKADTATRIRTAELLSIKPGKYTVTQASGFASWFLFFGADKLCTGWSNGWSTQTSYSITVGSGVAYYAAVLRYEPAADIVPSAATASRLRLVDTYASEATVTAIESRTSTLEQDLSGFELSVAETYTTKTEFGNLEIGGTNLLPTGTVFPANGTESGIYYADFHVENGRLSQYVLEAGQPYVFSADVTTNVVPFDVSVGCGTSHYSQDIETKRFQSSGRVTVAFTPTAAQLAKGTLFAFRAPRYSTTQNFTWKVDKVKLEKGTRATDWSPAPQDAAMGGRNLLRFTASPDAVQKGISAMSDLDATEGWYLWNVNAAPVTRTDDGIKVTHVTGNTSLSGLVVPLVEENALAGEETTMLSFDYRTNLTSLGPLYLLCRTGGNSPTSANIPITKSETNWAHFEQEIRFNSTEGKVTYALLIPYVSSGWIEFKDRSMKLEKGRVATPWTATHEDSEASVRQAKAEIKITTDGITSTVSKIGAIKYFDTTYSYSLANIKTYSANGYSGGWNVTTSTDGTRVGDVVYLKLHDTTRNCDVYLKGTVTTVNSSARLTITSHGYEDMLPVETIKSTINQSADSVKIQAKHVDIEGAAIFTGSGRLSSTSLNNAYDSKGSASNALTSAKSYADNLEIGGVNLLPKSYWAAGDTTRSGVWVYSNLHEFSYIPDSDSPSGYAIRATVNDASKNASLYLANLKDSGILKNGEKYVASIWIRASKAASFPSNAMVEFHSGTYKRIGTSNLTTSWQRQSCAFTYSSSSTYGAFYLVYPQVWSGLSNYDYVEIGGIKIEKGEKPTDWSPCPEDQEGMSGGRNLFSWPVSGTKWKDEEHALSTYQNTGSFSQFTNSLTFDPLETIGELYTISFDVKSPNGTTAVNLYNSNSTPSAFYFPTVTVAKNVGNEWVHCSHTVENAAHANGNASYNRRIEIYAPSATGVLVRKIKVEKGSRETDWTPAPEDVDAAIEAVPGFKYLNSNYTNTLATIQGWCVEGTDAGNWAVTSTDGVRVGDTVYIKTVPSDNNGKPVYCIVTVTSVVSATVVKGISHGYLDTAVTDTANAAAPKTAAVAEEQYVYASYVSGTNSATGPSAWVTEKGDKQNTWSTKRPTYSSTYPVVFVAKQRKTVSGAVTCTTPIKDDTVTIIDGGHITTGTIDATKVAVTNLDASKITSGYLNSARIQAGSLSIGKLSDLDVGGRNLILDSRKLDFSILGSASGSRKEYYALNVGQSYMDVPHGTKVTISFDLKMTVATANPTLMVYNTNNAGPKAFSNSPTGTGSTAGVTLTFTAAAGSTIEERVSVTGYINNRSSSSKTDNFLEFYSTYNTNNFYAVSNLKMERGSIATDWTAAPEDTTQMVKIDTSSRAFTTANWKTYGAVGHVENWTTGNSYDNSRVKVGDTAYLVGTVTDGVKGTATIIGTVTKVNGTNGVNGITMESKQLIFGGDSVDAAAKTATNYITADSSGIKIHNASDTTNYQHQTSSGTDIYVGGKKRSSTNASGLEVFSTDGTTSLAQFGTTSRIGSTASGSVRTTSTGIDFYKAAAKVGSITMRSSSATPKCWSADYMPDGRAPIDIGTVPSSGLSLSTISTKISGDWTRYVTAKAANGNDTYQFVISAAKIAALVPSGQAISNYLLVVKAYGADKRNTTISIKTASGSALSTYFNPYRQSIFGTTDEMLIGANVEVDEFECDTINGIPVYEFSVDGHTHTSSAITDGKCYVATTIYAFNTSGTSGTVTLTQTAANFTFVDIFFKGNDGYYDFTRVYSPNGKVVNLSTMESTANGSLNCKWKAMTISGTSITNKYYGEMDNGGTPASVNHIYVCGVIGYK